MIEPMRTRTPAATRTVMVIALGFLLAFFFVGTPLLQAQVSSVGLGTADGFAVLAGSTITNTGPTTITGDVGLHPGSSVVGFGSVTLNGAQHITDAAALQAKNNLVTAYNDAAGSPLTATVATELGGQTLTGGVYNSASGTFQITGTLNIDAQGDPNAVFIFQMASTLVTASASNVNLLNGAQACNVFWQVGSSATLGTSSFLSGNILALQSISLTTGAKIEGRALARNGAVTMDTNTITRATCTTASTTTTTLAESTTSSTIPQVETDLPAGGNSTLGLAAGLAAVVLVLLGGTILVATRRDG